MPYHGLALDPVPEHVSSYSWLFGPRDSSRYGTPVAQSCNGIRDAETHEHLPYRALAAQATYAATALATGYGVGPKTTVAVLSRNSINYNVAVFAAGRLGATVAVLPSMALAPDIAYFLEASKAQILLYDSAAAGEVAKVARAAASPAGSQLQLIALDTGAGTGVPQLPQLVRDGKARGPAQVPEWTVPAEQTNKSICAFLAFSSGTTGKPKAVMISHHNIIAQLMQVRQLVQVHPGPMLGILPFYHITGLVHLIHLPVMMDQELVLMGQFDMQSMLEAVSRYQCEELWLVPPLLIRMVSDSIVHNYRLDCIRQFNTGAAPLPPQIIDKLAARYPRVALRQAWGMTESCSCITSTPPALSNYANAAKVGKPVPGTEVKIVSVATGQELPLGHEGELWARGPQITMGYANDADKSEKSEKSETYTADGFLRTGDLGTVHADGFVTIHDRLKEMIKVRGHGVAPAELEDVLLGHDKVADAAVIGIPHDYSGEVPRAYVVVAPGVARDAATAAELQQHVESLKPRYMRLAGGVEFLDEIPKSAAGKILRRTLRVLHSEQMQREEVKPKL